MSLSPSQDEIFLSKIDQFLDTNLEDEAYGVAELVNSLGISRSQLHRKLKSISGKSASSYIREYRLKRAYEMLKSDVASISEIAYKVGFASPSYFSTAFSKYYGYPPGETKFQNEAEIQVNKKPKLLGIAIGVLIVGVVGFFGLQKINTSSYSEVPIENSSEDKLKTIAVLAFEDLSDGQNLKYRGMGLAVEVINILDDVEGLKVIGKTSAFSFLDKNITIDSIAKILDVNYVMEGTISENEGEIEIVAILTDGFSGQTLSSERYRISESETSSLKGKIAKQLAYELKVKIHEDVILSSDSKVSELMALEQKAYYMLSKRTSRQEVIDVWDDCISLDSTYIPCIANRSRYHRNAEEHLYYVNKLMELDSTNVYTYYVKGNYFFEEQFDFHHAYLNYKKMLDKNPREITILSEAAYRVGFFDLDKGINHMLDAMKMDPLYPRNYYHLAQLYLNKAEYKKSIDLYYEYQAMTGSNFPWPVIFINIYGGFLEEAEIAMDNYLSDPDPGISKERIELMTVTKELFIAACKKEDLVFEEKLGYCIEHRLNPFSIASALALYGDHDRSFEWLEKGYESKNISFFAEIKYAPWLENMRSDPRWLIFMKKLGMPGYEDGKIET